MKKPLAFRLRPKTLDEVIGQRHLIGEGCVLRKCVEANQLFSMIFFGPPGTGKTTLASVLANEIQMHYRMFNAVTGNKKELEQIFAEAKFYPGMVVIVDEVHRLNKDKQDLLLPHVEDGSITLIGATTSNPLHAINPAIRSRCHLAAGQLRGRLSQPDVSQSHVIQGLYLPGDRWYIFKELKSLLHSHV